MTIFNEIKVSSKIIDDRLYIDVQDIANHIYFSALDFLSEAEVAFAARLVDPQEMLFNRGVATGMISIVKLLAQGGIESKIHFEINTVDDLLNVIDKKKDKKND